MPLSIRLTGPDLPTAIADNTILPNRIPMEPHWQETYHLLIGAPLITMEVAWGPDDPLRILNFSRGNWESYLLKLAVSAQ